MADCFGDAVRMVCRTQWCSKQYDALSASIFAGAETLAAAQGLIPLSNRSEGRMLP
jgi:hypothetical protein